jgi:hypothetical protein
MNTLNYELPSNEKALLPSPVVRDRSWVDFEEMTYLNEVFMGYDDQAEYVEIDPFTGRIRTIRHN